MYEIRKYFMEPHQPTTESKNVQEHQLPVNPTSTKNSKKILEFIGALIVLFFMGTVLLKVHATPAYAPVAPAAENDSLSPEQMTPEENIDKNENHVIEGNVKNDDPVVCPADAMQCPDGSYVGRTGPHCDFAACPTTTQGDTGTCSPESRFAEECIELYAPVCAQVQVECITTPCEPVPQTFSNSCFACANERVTSYVDGACVDQ